MNITPINPIDFSRFKRLAEFINQHQDIRQEGSPGTKPEIKIYTSQGADEKCYVSLEIRGYIPSEEAYRVMNDLSLLDIKI